MKICVRNFIYIFLVLFIASVQAEPNPEPVDEKKQQNERYDRIKEACKKRSLPDELTRVDCRISKEGRAIAESNTLIPHKQNYILFYAYESEPNLDTWIGYEGEPNNQEVIFQISFKYPVWVQENKSQDIFSLFIGYTQKSFWQLYNKRNSSPFRESNYEPEIMINYVPKRAYFWGIEVPVMTLAFNHQSNGQTEPKSRSWNRIYLNTVFARGNYALSLRPWYRIPESKDSDDNRHILDYMGRGDVIFAYSNGKYQASMLLRNNLEITKENRGAVQIDFGFPILFMPRFQFYIQAFHGYGESLIDYDYSSTRFGVGILTTNWL